MRAGFLLSILIIGLVVAAAMKNRNYSHFMKHRARPREIRGFKPEYISTAIGFGKREDSVDNRNLGRRERILSTLLQNFPRGVPVDWIIREMKVNPVFAEKLTQLLLDDQNDFPTADHPEEDKTVFLL